jgi:ribosomal protein L19E
MTEILALLQNIAPLLEPVNFRQMSQIIFAMMVISGRITMLGLSRWADKGGSYRTIQRWYQTQLPWEMLHWTLFLKSLLKLFGEYILAGDETVIGKAGKETYGLDRFFSGLKKQVIPGLSFFVLSLVSVDEEHSYPLQINQVVKSAEEKAASQAKKEAQKAKKSKGKRKPGRPKGSKNKVKSETVVLNPELLRIQQALRNLLKVVRTLLSLKYVVLDGHFGNYPSAFMVKSENLDLISKMRFDAALYEPAEGEQTGPGRPKKYGKKVAVSKMDEKYLKATSTKDNLRTEIYQGTLYNKEFAFALNVVIILKTNLLTETQAHVILFSTDLKLDYEKLIKYYSLRFQIEFNFRDAKQYWGLEDFMNIKETAVTNAVNLSFFMVNFSHGLLQSHRKKNQDFSVLDLKSHYRGYRYACETIKMLPQKPDGILLAEIFQQIARLGAIHAVSSTADTP